MFKMRVRKLPSINPDDPPKAIALKKKAIERDQEAHTARQAAQRARGTSIYGDLQREAKNATRRAREALRRVEALSDPGLAAQLEKDRRFKNETKNKRRQDIKKRAASDPSVFPILEKEKEQKKRSRKKVQDKRRASKRSKKQYQDHCDEFKDLENSSSLDDICAILDEESKKMSWRNERVWYNIVAQQKAGTANGKDQSKTQSEDKKTAVNSE